MYEFLIINNVVRSTLNEFPVDPLPNCAVEVWKRSTNSDLETLYTNTVCYNK